MVWTGKEVTGTKIRKRRRAATQQGYLGPKKFPLPENKYIYDRSTEYCVNAHHTENPNIISGNALQFESTTPSWVAEYMYPSGHIAFNKANAKMFSRVDTFRTNLAEVIATRQQTVGMISEKIRGITRIARAVRRGNSRELKRMFGKRPKSKDFANRFLEYSFGWVPLVSDIYELASNVHEPPKETIRVTSFAKRSLSTWYTWGSLKWNGSVDVTAKCNIKLQIRVKNTAEQFLRDYGVTDPALLAWEALPYSFVVDWIYPVGTYLQNRSAFDGLEITRSCVTMDYTSNWFGSMPPPGIGWAGAQSSGILKRKERNHRKFSTKPPVPHLKNPFSMNHFFLSLALLRQQLK